MAGNTALKVVTIGAGYFAQFHHEAWQREPRVHLAAVCDNDPEKAGAMAARFGVARTYTDPAEMIAAEKPDLIDIITPPPTHRAMAALAAEAGLPAICQKAFCTSFAEAKQVAASAEAANTMLVVHENFRFSPWFREVSRVLASGQLGDLYQVSFRMRPGDGRGADAYLSRQPYFQQMERFLVHETAIHFIDTFRYLIGEPTSVYADLRRLNPVIAGEDAGIIVFDFGSGVRALFDGNRLSDHVAENRRLTMGELMVEGSGGTLTLTGDGGLAWRAFGSNDTVAHDYAWSREGFAGDAVFALQRHVVDHLLDGALLENSAHDYLQNLAIEDAIYRSASEGARLSL